MVNIWLLYVVVNMWWIWKKIASWDDYSQLNGQIKFMFQTTNQTYVCWFPKKKCLNINYIIVKNIWSQLDRDEKNDSSCRFTVSPDIISPMFFDHSTIQNDLAWPISPTPPKASSWHNTGGRMSCTWHPMLAINLSIYIYIYSFI